MDYQSAETDSLTRDKIALTRIEDAVEIMRRRPRWRCEFPDGSLIYIYVIYPQLSYSMEGAMEYAQGVWDKRQKEVSDK